MRYFIGFLITIGLIILLIILLFTGGGDGDKKPRTTKALADYASSSAVARLTIDGPINADQNHQVVRITVGQNETEYEQIQGYEGHVLNRQVYANNQNAYSNFLYALGHAGFTQGDRSKLLANEKGHCPLGQRYVFELIENDKRIERYWSSSCGNIKSYNGNLGVTLKLFQAQVPDYDSLTQSLTLSQ